MKKSLSLFLSAVMVALTLFALPFNAMAEPKNIEENPLTIEVKNCKFDEYKAVISDLEVEVKDGEKVLVEDKDYEIDFEKYALYVEENGTTILNYSINGIGDYTGWISASYTAVAPTKGKAGKSANWVFDKKTKLLRISGSGAFTDARSGDAKSVYIDGVSSISPYWYNIRGEEYNLDVEVTNVTVTGKVKTIGEDAFRVCNTKNIDIQSGVKTLKTHAISPLSKYYKSIYIPKSVTKIGKQAVGYVCKAKVYEEDKYYNYSKVKGFVIIGESGSAAQKYAKKNKFKFVALKPSAVSKVKGAKKSFTVNYKKAKGATGYQVQYSKNKYFASGNKTVKVKGAKNVKKTVKKLKAGKYYVRVRTYKTVKKKTYYSNWSKAKAVTVK